MVYPRVFAPFISFFFFLLVAMPHGADSAAGIGQVTISLFFLSRDEIIIPMVDIFNPLLSPLSPPLLFFFFKEENMVVKIETVLFFQVTDRVFLPSSFAAQRRRC